MCRHTLSYTFIVAPSSQRLYGSMILIHPYVFHMILVSLVVICPNLIAYYYHNLRCVHFLHSIAPSLAIQYRQSSLPYHVMPILALLTSSLAAMSNPSKILSSISRFYLDSYEVCLLEFTSLVLYGMPETQESVFHGSVFIQ